MEIIDPKNTKKRMDERLEMMHKLYSDSEVRHIFSPSGPMTNADHIRSMTDEELAKFIASGVPKDVCRDRCGGDEGFDCSECVLDWLKEEV